jgi:hypothetical protein
MKPNKTQRQRRARGNGQDFPRPPPTSQLAYKGVIPTRTSERGITAILRQTSAQATGVGVTTLNPVLGNNPSSADNWADYAAAWTQYRVLGVRVEWQPYDTSTAIASIAKSYGAHIHTILHQTGTPSTNSVANCFSSGDSKPGHLVKPHVRTWKMLDANEANWIATSAPASTSFVYSFYANNLLASTTYGYLYITYFVQFRTSNT